MYRITCMDEVKEIATDSPEWRLAVVTCEDDRHVDDPMSWMFWIGKRYHATRVADNFWEHNGTCLDIDVEITTVADFLAGREGETTGFSVPVYDREVSCDACGEEYAVWQRA